MSKTYIIYESNGIVKEYICDKDILLFEGTYLNGKRSGKGKEYNDDGNLIFEGEYLKGERNGLGKEYDYRGRLRFEGEYLNGQQWIGYGYDDEGNLKYQLNNEINGMGKEYDE